MTKSNNTAYITKIRFLVFLFIIGFSFIFIFLFRWQIVDAEKFEEMATERIRNVEIPALRGSIYSSDGTTLAYSERRFDIFVYLPEVERAEDYGKQTRNEYVTKVSGILGIKEEDLEKLLDSGPLWIKIASKLTHDQKEKIVNLKTDATDETLAGNFVEYTSERLYPENQLASHVVGFYGSNSQGELVGRGGIEYTWEKSLRSIEGFQTEEVDSFGNTITITDFKPIDEQRGTDIYLTIDLKMQAAVERNLEDAVKRYRAVSGASVLMDPKTGEILAIANYPTFNPNEYTKVKDPEAFNDRAVTVPYEFGSVGKIFTISGAIEEKVVEPSTVILPNGHHGCEYFMDPNKLECRTGQSNCRVCTFDKLSQPKMTVADGLIKSDNIALYETSKKLGKEGLYKYLSKFGIGRPTSIELSESNGLLIEPEDWTIADQVTYSYGHGYQATLLQVATGVGAVANDGKLMQPYIISKVLESDGTEKTIEPLVVDKPISPDTAKVVGGILGQVYRNNVLEGYYRDLLDYDIAMKSGTALIPFKDRPGYSNEINTTYIGYDLSKDKSFILAVWLESPKVGTLASHNARILWLETFRDIKDDLRVPKK